MKVLCIDGVKAGQSSIVNSNYFTRFARKEQEICEGDIYNVRSTYTHKDGSLWYYLVEITLNTVYNSNRFVPINGRDEIEIAKERESIKIKELENA